MGTSVEKKGPRLAYVTRKLSGTIKRRTHYWDAESKSIASKEHLVEAGYLVYLPTGQVLHLTHAEVVRRGLDKDPPILGFEQVTKPDSAAGRFKFAYSDAARRAAYAELEQEVIKVARSKHGPATNLMDESYEPKGKLNGTAVA